MTFSLDSLAMEAAHAALALTDPANAGVVADPWGPPPQMPFNYAWGRVTAAQNVAAAVSPAVPTAAVTEPASLNEALEAARRGRGRPKKEQIDGVGAEAGKGADGGKKSPAIRGRGRPPRNAEANEPPSASLYDKFPLPPGLQSSVWPTGAPPYLRLPSESSGAPHQPSTSGQVGVDLSREPPPHGAHTPRSSEGGGAPNYVGGCQNNICCPPPAPSDEPVNENSESVHHHHHHPGQGNHQGMGNGHGAEGKETATTPTSNANEKLPPSYPPFSVHAPGPTCFPGKQMFMVSSPVSSPPPPPADGSQSVFKQSPPHPSGGGCGGGSGGGSGPSQHHQKNNSNKQIVSRNSSSTDSSAASSSSTSSALAVIPKPIMLGGTNVGCPICFKIFGSKGLLSQHMLVHTDVRKHACLYCDKSFKQQSHLKAHIRIHTGERPYKCTMPDCGRDFVQMANLQFHLRNHEAQRRRATEEKTGHRERVRCPMCYKGFDSGLGLERHMFDFHEPAVIDQELSLSNSNSN